MSTLVTVPNILLAISIGIIVSIFLLQIVVSIISSNEEPTVTPNTDEKQQSKKKQDNLIMENRRLMNAAVSPSGVSVVDFPTRISNVTIDDDDVTLVTSEAFGSYYIISVDGDGKLILELDNEPVIGQSFVIYMATSGTIGFESSDSAGSIVNSTNTVSGGEYGALDDSLESGFVYTYVYLGTVSNPGQNPASGNTSYVISRYISVPNIGEDVI